jgi:peptide/nickel transport system permease protein
MFSFTVRSFFQKLVTLFLVSVISFLVVYLAPGEPSQIDPLNPKFTPEDIEKFKQEFNLDKPLHVQYYLLYSNLFTGKLKSWKDNQPVLYKVYEKFQNSLWLFVVGMIVTWFLSFPVGIKAALSRGAVFDKATTFLAFLLISIPGFFIAILSIVFVVRTFHVSVIGMSTFGMSEADFIYRKMDEVWHLVLPSILSAVAGIAFLSRYVRAEMLEVINQDYIRTAKSKGLSSDIVHYKHALRNALLPFITMFGLSLPGLIGGSVIIETIFSWPGMGRMSFEAIMARDYPVIISVNFIAAVLVLIGTFISDLLYTIADPRIKL